MKCTLLALVAGMALPLAGQDAQPRKVIPGAPVTSLPVISRDDFTANSPANTPTSFTDKEYRVGRDDLIDVNVFDAPELAGSGRVSASGTVSLPVLGVIRAAGKTTQELEQSIEAILNDKILNNAHVTVFVREYASQPVSVMGAVKVPSIYQIKGEKSLLDMITMAQGIDPLMAGRTIQVIRRSATTENGKSTHGDTISIDIVDLLDNGNTELNIPIMAGDIINVVRAGSIFVEGEVTRPDEFVLRDGKNVTVLQAIARANGPTKDAKRNDFVVIRVHRDGSKEEIHVDYSKVVRGNAEDVTMLPNDILFVPANKVKSTLNRALESTITVAMGRLIYTGL